MINNIENMINTSHVWQFSESSQPQLKRLLSFAMFDPKNKWIQKLGIKPPLIETDRNTEIIEILSESSDSSQSLPAKIENAEGVPYNKHESKVYEEFCREITDPIAHINLIVDMCLKDENAYQILISNLSNSSIEKVCNYVFTTNELNPNFVEYIYKFFLPAFLKEHTWLSLDLLVKAKESHSKQFKMLFLILLNEKDLPNTILQEFITTLNVNEVTNLIVNLADNDINNEMFSYNMYTIYLAYKDCNKNEQIQDYILTKLTQLSEMCATDKCYGRFLLTFIQTQNDMKHLKAIEKLIDKHRSPFKKLCSNALNSIIEE